MANEHARALAAQRRIERKPCAVCGTVFQGIKKARYCSGACASRAARERWGAERVRAYYRAYYARKRSAAARRQQQAEQPAEQGEPR
jgi:hypothetical protein